MPDDKKKPTPSDRALSKLLGTKSPVEAPRIIAPLPPQAQLAIRAAAEALYTDNGVVECKLELPPLGLVRPGEANIIKVATSDPDLDHTLTITETAGGAYAKTYTIKAATPFPAEVPVDVPNVPSKSYQIQFTVPPSSSTPHVSPDIIQVKTPEPLTLTPITSSHAAPIPGGTDITFSTTMKGGMPPYGVMWAFDNGKFDFKTWTAADLADPTDPNVETKVSGTTSFGAGTYTVEVYVGDAARQNKSAAFADFTINPVPPG